jgi:hypothetical protein
MAWRLARSLVVLRNEVRALHPGTTVWDIGDESHQGTASDHNPNPAGVVCATDTLRNAGLDLGWYAERVRQAGLDGHPAPKYVIYNRRIASRSRDWTWRTYGGSNPHTSHVHVSVGNGPDGQSTGPYDDTSPWGLLAGQEADVSFAGLNRGDRGGRVSELQLILKAAGFYPGTVDGVYGAATSAGVLAARRSLGSNASDGDEIGPTASAQIRTAHADARARRLVDAARRELEAAIEAAGDRAGLSVALVLDLPETVAVPADDGSDG